MSNTTKVKEIDRWNPALIHHHQIASKTTQKQNIDFRKVSYIFSIFINRILKNFRIFNALNNLKYDYLLKGTICL